MSREATGQLLLSSAVSRASCLSLSLSLANNQIVGNLTLHSRPLPPASLCVRQAAAQWTELILLRGRLHEWAQHSDEILLSHGETLPAFSVMVKHVILLGVSTASSLSVVTT